MRVLRVGNDIYLIDHMFFGEPGLVATYAVIGDGGECSIIDPGPRRTVNRVIDFLEERGLKPKAVFLTHIHLDHAGGAEDLVKRYPDLRVYVHPRGAKHLVNPSKLCASAREVVGINDVDAVGCIDGIPEKNVVSTTDGMLVDIGGRRFRILHTPGHASHHQVMLLDDTIAFTGDALGMYVCECVIPLTPPPTRIDLLLDSVEKVREAKSRYILMPHYGLFPDLEALVKEYVHRLILWASIDKEHELLEKDVCARRVENARRHIPYFRNEVLRCWRGFRQALTEALLEKLRLYAEKL